MLGEGSEYTLAIALHENHGEGRHHYTAFPMKFSLGESDADMQAKHR